MIAWLASTTYPDRLSFGPPVLGELSLLTFYLK